MAKKRKTTKQQAWAVVDRETGEVKEESGQKMIYSSREKARFHRRIFFGYVPIVTVARITIHH